MRGQSTRGIRDRFDERSRLVQGSDVDDEGIVRGPFLRGKDALNGAAIECMRAESVDGLGRKGDEPSAAKAFGGARDHRRVRTIGIDS